jgi:hypothetical protein
VVTAVEGNGDLRPFKVLGGGGFDRHDLMGCEFLLLPRLIRLRATIDIVDLIMSFGEVTIPGLVLSLGRENADAI